MKQIFAILFLTLSGLLSARAQVDLFLRFIPTNAAPTVKGDSTDPTYRGVDGWMNIRSFSLGVNNPTTIGSATGGAGVGRATFLEVNFAKDVNSGSPALFQALTSGAHFDTAQVMVRRAGARNGEAYLSYEFRLVYPTAQTWAGGGDVPEEDLRFVHGGFRITYRPQNADGTLGPPVVAQWSQVTNTPTF